jgi:nitroreductase
VTAYALDGKASRKKNNALAMEFVDGAKVASAVQSGADGRGRRVAILMGFRNGGPGRHAITYVDGREHVVEVDEGALVRVMDGTGQPVATITAGTPSEYRSADGATVLLIEPDGEPSRGKVPMLVRRPDGPLVAQVVDVRTNTEWKVRDSLRAAGDLYLLLTASGAGSLPMKRFGTQISAEAAPSPGERDALIAISVAICIGMVDLVPQLEPAKRSG